MAVIEERETGFRKLLRVDDYCFGCGEKHYHHIVEQTVCCTLGANEDGDPIQKSTQAKYVYYYCENTDKLIEDEDMLRRNQKEYRRVWDTLVEKK